MKKLLSSLTLLPIFLFTVFPAFASSYSDSFTDVDGTTLPNHNVAWHDCTGDILIQNNKAIDTGLAACFNSSWSDGYISFDYDFVNGNSHFGIRKSTGGNWYDDGYQLNIKDNGDVDILVQHAPVYNTIILHTTGNPTSGTHNYKLAAYGNVLEAFIDGVSIGSVTDSSWSSGYTTLYTTDAVDNWVSFDDNDSPTPTPTPSVPTNKDHCKKDGWKNFTNPTFKNQGSCISFVEKQK